MLEFEQVLTTALGALFGALFGGAVSWGNARRERRIALTLQLYAEFHSPGFNQLRIRAYDALTADARPMPQVYATAGAEEREAIYTMLTFFERVALLRKADVLDDKMLRRFLGQYAQWWRPLLCGREDLNAEDPEWGKTLKEIDRLFARLGG